MTISEIDEYNLSQSDKNKDDPMLICTVCRQPTSVDASFSNQLRNVQCSSCVQSNMRKHKIHSFAEYCQKYIWKEI